MKLIPVLLILYFLQPASACPLLKPAEEYSARFTQKRIVRGLKKPIVSSGEFEIEPGKQVVWRTLSPIESTVIINANGFSVDDKEYNDSRLRKLSGILLELHSGQFENLKDNFTSTCAEKEGGEYHLRIEPKKRQLKRIFSSIELIGKKTPHTISFSDSRGDITLITFAQ